MAHEHSYGATIKNNKTENIAVNFLITFDACFRQPNKEERKEKVKEVIKMVGLEGREKDKVKIYSLGMKQRLGIAQALLNDPKIIILDEPSNGLDPLGMIELREIILRLNYGYYNILKAL